jgi:hypothetical protein
MTPIAFSKEHMHNFISERFVSTPASVQEQALSWLQVIFFDIECSQIHYDFAKKTLIESHKACFGKEISLQSAY